MPVEKLKQTLADSESTSGHISDAVNLTDHYEIARLLHQFSKDEKVTIFQSLEDDKKRQEVLYETDKNSREEIIESCDNEYIAKILDEMPEDEATDILKELEPEESTELLEIMPPQEADIIQNLIQHGEETAGGLMDPNYNKVLEDQTAAEILMKIKKETNSDQHPYYYVVSRQNELLGFFKLRDLLNVPPHAKAITLIRKETPKVLLDDSCEQVANLMNHEHVSSVPVVDGNNILHGVITFDDVIRAMKDIASEDIFTMVGTDTADPFAQKTYKKIAARAPWLFTTFLGGLVSAFVLGHYQTNLREFATVIFFIPFVIGLAGNVGIQGATVIVRGWATGDIQDDNLKAVVFSELFVGIVNGFIFGLLCGTLVASIAEPLLQSSPFLGLSVGTGIFLAVAAASLIGSFTPIYFIKLNIDPAISTGPMVTVINDITGLVIYLATTSLIFSII